MSADHHSVPHWLQGCWRREWIEFADGARNDTDHVYWLQTDRAMADVRVAAGSHDPASMIASTGFTTTDGVVVDEHGVRRCVAQWHSYGVGANFQPECTFPEPGLLEVDAAGTVMIERAPSGAYVEEWHLVPGSADVVPTRRALPDGRELFVAGPIAVLAPEPTCEEFRACEFSVAHRCDDGSYRVVISTVASREGAILDVVA